MEPKTVESLCNLLGRSRLLPAEEVRSVRQRWLREAKEGAADLTQFSRWLVTNQYLTDYQAGILLRGRADRFFLNEYKLLERIGAGRMAGVFKAVHRLGQVVAIKVLPPSKARDAQVFARFQREARLALRLEHPNVVRTFQVGEDDGLHYLVMEYLEGETLEEVLARRGRLPPLEAAGILHQALLGLQCLQEEGVVHRDLKPANLMLVPPGPGLAPQASPAGSAQASPVASAPGVVKILDIGVGRALFDEGEPGGAPNADLTGAGDLLGAPDYMSPEQGRNAHAADIRSDIYSLGCIAFQMLAGEVPFLATNLVQQMLRHATEPAPRLADKGIAGQVELQGILDTMMAKDPAQRYPTPAAAAKDVELFLSRGQAKPPPAARVVTPAYLQWLATQGQTSPGPPPRDGPLPALGNRASLSSGIELVPLESQKSAFQMLPLGRRDFIFLALGAGALVVVEAIVWLILLVAT